MKKAEGSLLEMCFPLNSQRVHEYMQYTSYLVCYEQFTVTRMISDVLFFWT